MGVKGYKRSKYNDISSSQRSSIKTSWEKGCMTNPEIMRHFNISHANLYRLIKEWNEEKKSFSNEHNKKTGGSTTIEYTSEQQYDENSPEYEVYTSGFDVENFERELYESHKDF